MKGGTGGLRSLEAEEGHRQLCSILFSFIPPPALPPPDVLVCPQFFSLGPEHKIVKLKPLTLRTGEPRCMIRRRRLASPLSVMLARGHQQWTRPR